MPYIGRSVNYGNAVTEQFVGDGSADYTLAYETITDGVVVSLDGVVQVNGTDFNILGTVITFTSVVASPIDINIIYLGLTISVGTPADSTITLAKMAVNSVDSDQYVDGSIDNVHLADDAVNSDELATGAVDNDHMAVNSIDSDQYVDGSIDGVHLAVGKDGGLSLDATPDTDHTANGPQTSTLLAGYTTALMDLVYLDPNGRWEEADADATGSSISLLGIALEVKDDGEAMNVALPGSIVVDASWSFGVGVPLYVHTTAGAITATKPTGSGDVVRTVGYSLSATTIFFDPSPDYVTLA